MRLSDFEFKAIAELSPGAIFRVVICDSIFDDIKNNLIWLEGKRPTDAKIKAKAKELFDVWNSLQYSRDRKEQYPSIQDQLDTIFHEGIDAWKEQIQAVKDKYPKP